MVVFVVGIMAGLTVMSIGGNPEREFRRDVARMQQVLGMAQDEAPFAGQEIGFWLDPAGTSYSFFAFDNEKLVWNVYEEEGFTKRDLPAQYRLELEMDGDPVDLGGLYKEVFKIDEELGKEEDKALVIPWLVFFSDGHYTPFRLWLAHPYVKEHVYVLEGDGLSDIRMRQVEARQMPEHKQDE